jgi:hypothetical protein
MDWLAKMIGLPNDFLHSHADTTGGGVIQVSQRIFYSTYQSKYCRQQHVKQHLSHYLLLEKKLFVVFKPNFLI